MIAQAKDVYFDAILKMITNLPIPDLYAKDNKDYLLGNTLVIQEQADDVRFYTQVAENAIVLEMDNLSCQFFSEHFRAKETIFVAKGDVEVDMKDVKIVVGLSFSTLTLSDGRVVPAVSAVDVDFEISRRHLDIHLHGNLWADLGDLFEVFFKGTVIDLIQDTVVTTLNAGIPAISTAVMTKTDGYAHVPLLPNWMVDWETPEPALVTDIAFEIGVKGLMFDKQIGEEEPGVEIPDLPYHDATKTEQFQAYISDYSIDGFASSFIEVIGVHGWVNATEIPATVPLSLDTATVNILLPGISDYYGDVPVDVHFDVT